VRLVGLVAEPAVPVGFVVLVVALEPHHLAVALEGEDVGGDAVEEPAVVADHHGAAGEVEQRLFQRAQRVDVEVVGRLVEQQQVAAALEQLGQVHPVALAAREVADLLLLVGAAEVERRAVGARVDLALAHHDQLAAAVGDLLPHRLARRRAHRGSGRRRTSTTVSPMRSAAAVRLLLADDHAEQRRLAGAVGADDADDAAGGRLEVSSSISSRSP
jgi:hypothetical protein